MRSILLILSSALLLSCSNAELSKETQEVHLEMISHCKTVEENLSLVLNKKELHDLEIEQGMPTTMTDEQAAGIEAQYEETLKLDSGCKSYFERYGR